MLTRVLLALPPPTLERVQALFAERGVLTSVLSHEESLVDRMTRWSCDLLVVSTGVLGAEAAARVARMRSLPEAPDVVVMAAAEEPGLRAALLAAGAMAVIFEGLPDTALYDMLQTLLRRRRAEDLRKLRSEQPEERATLAGAVAVSASMSAFLERVRRVVESESPLLLRGELGVRKERLACAIHNDGLRGAEAFVVVDCSLRPLEALAAQLFGSNQGSFGEPAAGRRGKLELAHGGTIYLDEITELPLELQSELAAVLQRGTLPDPGGEGQVPLAVRWIGATRADLAAAVEAGQVDPGFQAAIAGTLLEIPPLRARREDIPELAKRSLERYGRAFKRPVQGLTSRALRVLCDHTWPGNVRELDNLIERAVLVCGGRMVDIADLPQEVLYSAGRLQPSASLPIPAAQLPLRVRTDRSWSRARAELLESFEREYLTALLTECGGRVGEAARRAQIDPRSLYDKMKRLGLRKEDFRGLGKP